MTSKTSLTAALFSGNIHRVVTQLLNADRLSLAPHQLLDGVGRRLEGNSLRNLMETLSGPRLTAAIGVSSWYGNFRSYYAWWHSPSFWQSDDTLQRSHIKEHRGRCHCNCREMRLTCELVLNIFMLNSLFYGHVRMRLLDGIPCWF